jgi:endo-1,4-beta-D-glucanase Y
MKIQLPPTKVLTLIILLLFFANFSYSQTQTFPANKVFSYGLMASNRSNKDALDNYNTWKNNFIEACANNRFRVKFDNTAQTVSEGIGYGMLLTVYKGDKTTFDGLWNYYKDNRNTNGVMNWKINGCSGILGSNGATDAELDVAMALIVADYQWGSIRTINYKTDAIALIASIKNKEIEANSFVIKPGDAFGGSSITNPSYFAPAYCRAFGKFTSDAAFWNNVAAKCYTILNANLSQNRATGGLVSDWCQASGAYSNDATGYTNQGKTYGYDAARTPWRIATDYVWYGNNDAKIYSKKSSDFVKITLGGTTNIKDGYNQNGTLIGKWHNATFVGAFACAAMGGENQTHLNESYTDLKNLNEPNSYFNQTLKTLYLFLMSGNFYLPPTVLVAKDTFNTPALNVSLYPNPNYGEFTVSAPIDSEITVIDARGKVVLKKTSKTNLNQINLKNQAPQFYFVHIEHDGKKEVKKVIVN